MRIRKGHRAACVPVRSTDPSCAHVQGLAHGNDGAGPESDGNQTPPTIAEPVAGCTSGDSTHQDLERRANGTLSAAPEEERLEVDLGRGRLSADGNSRRRARISEGEVLSISSIIQAGKGSAGSNSTSAPANAESVVTSDASVVNGAAGCSPPVAMEVLDQATLLLQSLKRVCTAAGNTGLTPKEAVAKIVEQGLPGLNEGGERLIVQVAKSFRGSAAFVEERGRYFMQDLPVASLKDFGISSSDTGNSSSRRQKQAVPSTRASDEASEIETAIEAAKQLQSLQRIHEAVGDEVGFNGSEEKATAERRVGAASRSKTSGVKPSSSPREKSGPRCNRDDGKGWRCFRPAESGFSLCKYHRDQIRRAEVRRRRLKNKARERSPVTRAPNPTFKEVVKASTTISKPDKTIDARQVASDDELPDQKRRRGVKAKSLKSIL